MNENWQKKERVRKWKTEVAKTLNWHGSINGKNKQKWYF